MRITVITVSYNSASTIADTLRCVACQSHPDIEHIVIDGASSDGTLDLIRREGRHVAQLVSESDRGIYDAMNKGLRLASGEWVGFLNADDVFANRSVVADIARVASEAGADAIYGDLVYVGQQPPHRIVRLWRSGAFRRGSLRLGWMPPHPTLYVRRSLIQTLGPFDDRLRIAADYEFMLRYLSRPEIKVAYLPQVLVHMRMGGASNRSLGAVVRKSREDLWALRANGVGGVMTLCCKNLRKLPQFFPRPDARPA